MKNLKFSNFQSEILGLIESGTIKVGALGLSVESYNFIKNFDLEKNYINKEEVNKRIDGYFKGLVVITTPALTKKALKDKLLK